MSDPHPAPGDEPLSDTTLPLLYNAVYCSRAAEGVDDAAVDRIIATSRRRNPVHAITGLLVFGSDIFFQWLEGPRDDVQRLLALLRTDARHRDMVVLAEDEEVRERLFPDWDMELVSAEHIREVLVDALDSADDERNAEALRRLLAQLETGALADLGRG